MKVKVATWRITWRYLLIALFVLVGLFGIFSPQFLVFDHVNKVFIFRPFPIFLYGVFGAMTLFLIIFYFFTINSYYYIIEDKYFTVKKYSKTLDFSYKNIEFIDIEESQKKKLVIFYTPQAKVRYLLADKDNVLLETLIKKCKNIDTVEEFRRKHPEEKY